MRGDVFYLTEIAGERRTVFFLGELNERIIPSELKKAIMTLL